MNKKFTCVVVGLFQILSLQAQTYFGKSNILAEDISGPRSAMTCDIDGDGNLDILSALYDDGKVVWSKNTDGNGHFSAPQVISDIDYEVVTVYAADLDGDGDLDVISGATVSVCWYENLDGKGTFGDRNELPGTHIYYITSVYAADMDSDGDMDILTASSEWDQISWHENLDGEGGFSTNRVISSSADGARCVYADDLDGDGDMDVLSASSNDYRVSRYLNNGDGTFSLFDLATSVGGVSKIYTCDVDGDSDKDVIVPSTGTGIVVFKNNGSGFFTVSQIITTAFHLPNSVHGSDFDGDGDIDLVSSASNDNNVVWYENTDGAGTFGPAQLISDNASGANSVSSGDVDGDGDADIISASSLDNKLTWYKNTDGAGNFTEQTAISSMAYGANAVFSSDLDGDGDKDILSASTYDDKIAWYENMDGLGNFRIQDTVSTLADGAKSVFAADIDGDGDQDVLSASLYDDKIAWYENTDGNATFGSQQVISTAANGPYSVHACDIDGDGDMDVLSASIYDNKIAWYENIDGAGSFGPQRIIANDASYAIFVSSGDIDGDGDMDVLAAPYYKDAIVWYENTDGLGTFSKIAIPGVVEGPHSVFASDIDNDGNLDILSASDYDDKVSWFRNTDGSGTFSTPRTITSSADGACSVYAGDLDGDGDMDVISASSEDGNITWYENYNIASGYFNYKYSIATGLDGACSVIADDFDGDGNLDVAMAAFFDNKVAWFKNYTLKITVQPQNSTVPCGSVATFSVNAVNADGYQWQVNNGTGFVNLSNNTVYSGVYEATLQISDATSGMNGYQYRCVNSNDAGSKNSEAAVLTINDSEKPVITSVYNDQTVNTNGNCEAALPDYTGSATATDNCDEDIDFTQSPVSGTMISGATNTVTITATDDLGNTNEVTFNVEVIDVNNPVITSNHDDRTVDANENCEAALPDYTGEVSATDNCDADLDVTQSPVAGTTISGTINEITLTVTDDAGNTDEVTFNVEVTDNTAPSITSVHNDRSVDAGADCEAVLPDYTGDVTVTDNCDTNPDVTQSPAAGTTISGTSNEVTLTVTDDAGNTDEVTFNVSVIDHIDPVITSVHNNQTVDANADCEASLPDYTGEVIATDNCDDNLNITQSPVAGSIISGTTNAVTLTVTDDAGNTDDVTFNVEVVDNSDPEITSAHNDRTVYANVNCDATLPDYTSDVTATDNCDPDPDITQSPAAGTTISGNTNEITLKVTDDAGNFAVVTFNVRVVDNINPVITSVHSNQMINANAGCEAALPDYTTDVAASDNCDADPDITQIPIPGTMISGVTNEITLTVTDVAGNTDEVSFNVEVIDNTKPVISSVYENRVVDANASFEAELPDYILDMNVSDNCDNDLDITQTPVAGTIISGNSNTVTLTVTDDAGNSAEVSFIVRVADLSPPVISSSHSDQLLGDDGNCEATLPDYTTDVTASDICDADLDITQTPPAGTIISGYSNSVTLKVTDDAGNSDEVTFNVGVTDNTNPVITSVHNDQTLNAGENCKAMLPDYTGDIIASDNCDATLDVSQSPIAGTHISGSTNTVTLTVTDDGGNTSTASFNVEVTDTEVPTISCVGDQTFSPGSGSSVYTVTGTELDPVSVNDNCIIDSVVNDFNNAQSLDGAQFPTGTTTVVWTVTDEAGNKAECSFDVAVDDITGTGEITYRGVSVHPNPTYGILHLDAPGNSILDIKVFDLTGNLLIDETDISAGKIDLSQLSNGVYIINIILENTSYTTRIVKE